jgi:two-component system, OmpR family, sensor kinase
MLRRIPIRLRITLAFAGVMAILLTGAGLFIRFSLAKDLDASIQQTLETRGTDVGALVAETDLDSLGTGPSPLTEGGATFAQVLDVDGQIVDATPLLRKTPLLTPTEITAAATAPVLVSRRSVAGFADPVRLLATIARPAGGPRSVVVVGASLGERDEAIRNLDVLLAIGVPIALLLASLAGYGVASAALQPVEAMRQRAAKISGASHGERLPVAPGHDEIHRLGETLNEMLGRTDAALAHERAFVADASHELRTPLAILKTELELALRGDKSADELRAAIVSAGEETDRLTQLAEDLLVIARADQGGLPVHTQPVLVVDLLDGVRSRFAARAAEEGRLVSIDDGGTYVVDGDRIRLEQALTNLLENALRHGQGPVRLWARTVDQTIELHVTDAGGGPPTDFLPQAFDRFSRADAARGRGGAGLGLAIVRAVARAHGGDAFVANVNGSGFDAWLSLPLRAP